MLIHSEFSRSNLLLTLYPTFKSSFLAIWIFVIYLKCQRNGKRVFCLGLCEIEFKFSSHTINGIRWAVHMISFPSGHFTTTYNRYMNEAVIFTILLTFTCTKFGQEYCVVCYLPFMQIFGKGIQNSFPKTTFRTNKWE